MARRMQKSKKTKAKQERSLNIYPELYEYTVAVTIVGDPNGLRYLASILNKLADVNQEKLDIPVGEREHVHLHANEQLGDHSCEVEICRADAKGTGELPDYTYKVQPNKNPWLHKNPNW
jgi:hypothetical protein